MSWETNKTFLTALSFICGLFFSNAFADLSPKQQNIDALAESTQKIANDFLQNSFELRSGYEYTNRFCGNNDRDTLQKLAQKASLQLQEIYRSQQQILKRIEDYPGDDWDELYGHTGLWRKIFSDIR